MFNKIKKKKGFTLIELLVVISIIGLLSSVVLTSLNDARAKARDAVRIQTLQEIEKALLLYYEENESYPLGYSVFDTSRYSFSINTTSWNDLGALLSPYILKMPMDPIENGSYAPLLFSTDLGYTYWSTLNGSEYQLTVRFENSSQLDCSTKNYTASFDYGFGFFPAGSPFCNPSNANDNIYVISS